MKFRLSLMNFIEFAVWGAYLTCMGNYLGIAGLGDQISWFYAIQGIVSIFMPTLMGIIADKYIQPQRVLGLCHLVAGGRWLHAWLLVAGLSGRLRTGTGEQGTLHNPLYAECGFLHADYCLDEYHRVYDPKEQRPRYREGFPAYPCAGNRWLHHDDVVRELCRVGRRCFQHDTGRQCP